MVLPFDIRERKGRVSSLKALDSCWKVVGIVRLT